MNLRTEILTILYKLFPFSLKGDIELSSTDADCELSCIINFYGRVSLLEGVLYSLAEQDLSKKRFEVILVEDRGGTELGRNTAKKFSNKLNIKYFAIKEYYGRMGYSRNIGALESRGRIMLFLDDDTIMLQNNFLAVLIDEFERSGENAIVPRGMASFSLLKGRYGFHEPYFPTNRCIAYSRDALKELGGFVSDIIGQEDVEFVIRFIASGKRFYNSNRLCYFHPPLMLNNLNKAIAVGISFAKLKKRYPFFVWLLLVMNGLRFLPLVVFPFNIKWRTQGKFSMGFFIGALYAIIGKEASYGQNG